MKVKEVIDKCNSDVGVNGISQVYGEMMSNSDCDCSCTAAEHESFTTVSYKPKQISKYIQNKINPIII